MTRTIHSLTVENTLERTWQDRLDGWIKSGSSKAAYCKSHGVNYHQMIYWSRKLSSKDESKPVARSTKPDTTSGFVAVSAPPQNSAQGISVRLPNGIEIIGVEEHNIAAIISQIIRQGVER